MFFLSKFFMFTFSTFSAFSVLAINAPSVASPLHVEMGQRPDPARQPTAISVVGNNARGLGPTNPALPLGMLVSSSTGRHAAVRKPGLYDARGRVRHEPLSGQRGPSASTTQDPSDLGRGSDPAPVSPSNSPKQSQPRPSTCSFCQLQGHRSGTCRELLVLGEFCNFSPLSVACCSVTNVFISHVQLLIRVADGFWLTGF